MRSALIPVLMPSGLPRRGLVCYHDLYDPTSSLASVPDLSGHGYALQRGSDAGADSNDPAWGTDGKGLVFTTDDYALTGNLLTHALPFTLIVAGKFDGSTFTLLSLSNGSAGDQDQSVLYNGAAAALLRSKSGATQYTSDSFVIPVTPVVLAVVNAGPTLTLYRLDTEASVTIANANPTGIARLGLACLARSTVTSIADAVTYYEVLGANRALSLSELQRAYRYLKAKWAARNIQVL